MRGATEVNLCKRLSRGRTSLSLSELEEDKWRIDSLTNPSAATEALENVEPSLLSDHLRHRVAQANADAGEVPAQEAREAIVRLARS